MQEIIGSYGTEIKGRSYYRGHSSGESEKVILEKGDILYLEYSLTSWLNGSALGILVNLLRKEVERKHDVLVIWYEYGSEVDDNGKKQNYLKMQVVPIATESAAVISSTTIIVGMLIATVGGFLVLKAGAATLKEWRLVKEVDNNPMKIVGDIGKVIMITLGLYIAINLMKEVKE